MSDHLSADQIRDFVIGAEVGISVDQFRAHLATCHECAAQLQAEAHLDHALWEVRQVVATCPGCQRLRLESETSERCDHCGAIRSVREFNVEAVLTQTGHGRVYLARTAEGKAVALKELVFAQVPSIAVLEAFEREAKILRQLEHTRIPRLVAHFQEGEGVHTRFYLAQEFVAGTSLQALLDDHRFDEDEAIDVARQVLAILVYLQSLSPAVFHRDVKPANLIRRPDGHIALVDFGSARELGATQGATLVGTVGYMPPEQLTGIVDKTTDLYALGATLIHLLSRRPPWQVLTGEPLWRRVQGSRQLRSYLERLVATNPRDRFADASQALQALTLISTGMARRRRNLKFAALGLAAVVIAPVAWQTAHFIRAELTQRQAAANAARVAGGVNGPTADDGTPFNRRRAVTDMYFAAHERGFEADDVIESFYRQTRELDRETTSDARVREIVAELTAFISRWQLTPAVVGRKIARLVHRFNAISAGLSDADREMYEVTEKQLEFVRSAFERTGKDSSITLEDVNGSANLLLHMIEAAEKEVARDADSSSAANDEASSPPDRAAEVAYLSANRFLLQGRFDDAVRKFKDAIDIDPRFADAYRGLGIAYAKLGKSELATRHYELYVQLRRHAPDADRVRQIIRSYRAIEADER